MKAIGAGVSKGGAAALAGQREREREAKASGDTGASSDIVPSEISCRADADSRGILIASRLHSRQRLGAPGRR